ncbi:MAG: protein-glutamate O-methyltransferase CheR [Peptococcaceae bacterium]|nr:protein-glutamate O-methyltransferase CheR [Peptococcaceae bacterium]
MSFSRKPDISQIITQVTTYEKFKDTYLKLSGLDLTFYKEAQMKRRIHSFMTSNGFGDDYTGFLKKLSLDESLFDLFFKHLTINVTQFFRDTKYWDSFVQSIIPSLLQTRDTLKLWSAGCSSGQEPYTMAMIFAEYFPRAHFSILATDIDVKVLDQAKAGVYNERDFATTPKTLIDKYLTKKDGHSYEVSPSLKRNITFQAQNLLIDTFPPNMDFIACRNVVIYFTDEAKSTLYQKFSQSLSPGGILFTGSTEHIFGAAHLGLHSKTPFFYCKV